MSKVILVTGANQGIGYEIVKQVAQKGHTVYLCARDVKRGQEALDKLKQENLNTVKFLQLDVTNQESVDAAVKQFSSEQDHLDILVNNAGLNLEMQGHDPSNVDIDIVKNIYEVNLFGVMRVTTAFAPLIKKTKNSSILNVSSGLGSLTFQSDPTGPYYKFQVPGYNTSKTALNMYTVGLAATLPEVRVNIVDPGYTATNLNNYSGYLKPEDSAAGIVKYGVLPDENNAPRCKYLSYDGSIHPW